MIHLRSIRKKTGFGDDTRFPFNIPAVQTLAELQFTTPLTLFVGENGSGKSTLLEAIALAAGSITVGSEAVSGDATLEPIRHFSRSLQLTWNKRTRTGFFLRAEDFFGFVKNIARIKQELETDLKQVDQDYVNRSEKARGYARMPYAGQLAALQQSYGPGLDARSHGESFLALFQSRFVPGGLYLLDEPEAPLSPVSQLGLIAILNQMIAQDAQFIIATHSPILMAFPGAAILDFDSRPISTVSYDDLQQVKLLRDFLNNPDSFLRRLE